MTTEWHARWNDGRIGFHKYDVHPTLLEIAREKTFFPGTVFVPLAGKTVDIAWLARRGAKVIAVELVDVAVHAFFKEHALPFDVESDGPLRVYRARDLDIAFYQGDLFDLEPRHLAQVSWTHDRASLVALPPEVRTRYGAHLTEILPRDARMLVTTFEYDQSEMSGPPFSVPLPEIERVFSSFAFTHERSRDLLEGVSHLRERGLTQMAEQVYLGTR